ncbi:MAG TPA: YfiR family protein [Acidobacteriota bacterium]|jgi:hypothetical protein
MDLVRLGQRPSGGLRKGVDFLGILVFVALLTSATESVHAQTQAGAPTEYEVKAAFLVNFAKYVEWPDDAAKTSGQVVIVVVGPDPFGSLLDEAVAGKTVRGRPLVVRRAARAEEIGDCQILFISASEDNRLPEILRGIAKRSVLTVGEGEQFALRGGMIGFRLENNRVRFDVNLRAAELSRIVISSQLLKLARVVREPRGSGGER